DGERQTGRSGRLHTHTEYEAGSREGAGISGQGEDLIGAEVSGAVPPPVLAASPLSSGLFSPHRQPTKPARQPASGDWPFTKSDFDEESQYRGVRRRRW